MNREFWTDRRVLVTGHTGFKGSWLGEWLNALGAQVHGLALLAETDPSLSMLLRNGAPSSIGDVRDVDAVRVAFERSQPEVVLHLAAQSLVRRSFADPVGTFATNVLGTATVLDAVAATAGVRAVVVVTSDKVYEPNADGTRHDEESPLGGHDPYSASKAACELLVTAYRHSVLGDRGVAVATARAGNVIGGGDWAADRVIPDALRARAAGMAVELRYPDAVRPWQHVLDPLHGYLLLAERLVEHPEKAPFTLNFGPADECTVHELVDRLAARLGGPAWTAAPPPEHAETAVLRLSATRAGETIGWRPCLELDDAIAWTAEWHLAHERGDDMQAVCRAQIEAFEQFAR